MSFALDQVPNLHGQKVLITGCSGGLGKQIAALFLACGARIAVHTRSAVTAEKTKQAVLDLAANLFSRQANSSSSTNLNKDVNTKGLAEKLAAHAVSVHADLLDLHAANALVTNSMTALDGLSGIINCAGAQDLVNFQELDAEKMQAMLAANVCAPHVITRAAAELMEPGSWITHISSIEGSRPAPLHTHYAASKAALIMHAKAAALELGAQGIRVNAVSPGLIDREGITEAWPAGVKSWLETAPLAKLVSGLEVAATCAFLAGDAASAITGINLPVDCGMLATPGWGG